MELEMDAVKKIETSIWNGAMTFGEYYALLEKLLAEGKTTGEQQTHERLEHARLNLSRMKRIGQQFATEEESMAILHAVKGNVRLLFIVEGWCGDAAQIVPALEKMVQARGWESKYILRDAHPEVMDMFLTHGSRSIPAVVALDEEGTVLNGHWGPRPSLLADLVQHWKAEMSKEEWHRMMHTWYAKDKGSTLQMDFANWIGQLRK